MINTEKYSEAAIRTRRRALGVDLSGTANVLRTMHEANINFVGDMHHNAAEFMDDKELQALAKVAKTLAACEGNLRKLSKRLGYDG